MNVPSIIPSLGASSLTAQVEYATRVDTHFDQVDHMVLLDIPRDSLPRIGVNI